MYTGAHTIQNGLIFGYDTESQIFYKGRPTTNISEDISLATYNNVSSYVSSVLTKTSELYRGAYIWKQVLTPLDSNGVYYLSNAQNPGIGVYTDGGGGLANRYTGHSIFFKPTVPMANPAIFTSYSNIGGWQSDRNYDDMGDGWFRANVIWYDTVTRSDGKYWAINPLSSTVNMPITIYWAGPFKEDLNSSTFVSQYTNGTRSATQSIIDLTGRSIISPSGIVYESISSFSFTESNPSYLRIPLSTAFNKTEGTMNFWVYPTSYNGGNGYFVNREDSTANAVDWLWIGPYGDNFYFRIGNGSDCCSQDLSFGGIGSVIPVNTWKNICVTWKINGTSNIYINGSLYIDRSIGNIPNTNPASNGTIGLGHTYGGTYFNGKMPIVSIYNRQLTSSEVLKNYLAHKSRFNL